MGVKVEPTFTAMASHIISFQISFSVNARKPSVKGMTINSTKPFVKNEANTQDNKTRNNAIFLSEFTFSRVHSAIIEKY